MSLPVQGPTLPQVLCMEEPGDHRAAKMRPPADIMAGTKRTWNSVTKGRKNPRQDRPLLSLQGQCSEQSWPSILWPLLPHVPIKIPQAPAPCYPGYVLSAWVFREKFRPGPWPEVLSQAGLLGYLGRVYQTNLESGTLHCHTPVKPTAEGRACGPYTVHGRGEQGSQLTLT